MTDDRGQLAYLNDREWTEYVLTDATRYTSEHGETAGSEWYDLRFVEAGKEPVGGYGNSIEAKLFDDAGVVPAAGDRLWLCGTFGRPNRGAMLAKVVESNAPLANPVPLMPPTLIFYRTIEEQAEHHAKWVAAEQEKRKLAFEEKGRAALDARYEALPQVFKDRIDRRRKNNPEFRWQFEPYEMFVCTEAVKMAEHMRGQHGGDAAAAADALRAYGDLSYAERDQIDKAAGLDDGHSGNTHGAAITLAWLYLSEPESVPKMYGAMAPLVGSEAYGDIDPDEPVEPTVSELSPS